MKLQFGKVILAILSAALLFSCSGEYGDNEVNPAPTCFDGIKNGDEIGIDCGWSCSNSCFVENGLEGIIVSKVILNSSFEYTLTGPLLIRDGGELEIRAGTLIKAQPNSNAYIAVAQGGRLYVYGTKDKPVVITSNAENPQPGDWGGIVICGNAPTNEGANSRSELVDIFYGGTNASESSGILKYLRVEYTGALFEETKTFNGISFFGVSSFTTAEYLQSFNGKGDGFKFYGGTIEPNWLVSTNQQENGIAFTEGWNGTGEFWHLSGISKTGVQISNNSNDVNASPITGGTISNISIIGPVANAAVSYDQGGADLSISDLYTSNIDFGIEVLGSEASSRIDDGNLTIINVEFDNVPSDFIKTNYDGPNQTFLTEGATLGTGNKAELPGWASGWTRSN